MARLGLLWLCMCAAAMASFAEGRAGRRREKPAGSRLRLAADTPEYDDALLPGEFLFFLSFFSLLRAGKWTKYKNYLQGFFCFVFMDMIWGLCYIILFYFSSRLTQHP